MLDYSFSIIKETKFQYPI